MSLAQLFPRMASGSWMEHLCPLINRGESLYCCFNPMSNDSWFLEGGSVTFIQTAVCLFSMLLCLRLGVNRGYVSCSYFLKACIEEFVATYDETSLGWNGADLLNRVASNATRKGGKVWLEQSEHLQVLEPIAFFPLSRHSIIKYISILPIFAWITKPTFGVHSSRLSLLLLVWVSSKISVLYNRYLFLIRYLRKLWIIRLVTMWNSFDDKIRFVLV